MMLLKKREAISCSLALEVNEIVAIIVDFTFRIGAALWVSYLPFTIQTQVCVRALPFYLLQRKGEGRVASDFFSGVIYNPELMLVFRDGEYPWGFNRPELLWNSQCVKKEVKLLTSRDQRTL